MMLGAAWRKRGVLPFPDDWPGKEQVERILGGAISTRLILFRIFTAFVNLGEIRSGIRKKTTERALSSIDATYIQSQR